MKQLLLLSGKGGTGKTTLAGTFIKLGQIKAYADCDVDAPNLHLLYDLEGDQPAGSQAKAQIDDFYGMDKALIDTGKCDSCDICRNHCRFDAIFIDPEKGYYVDDFACEGCGVCEYVCPTKAISMIPAVAGELKLYRDQEKVFSTAKLKMGSGNSGLLVTEVKNRMKNNALGGTQVAILDGSPGIGCPVIASVSGVDMVLIVAEPSISGISDMERIVKTAKQLGVSVAICVNKADTNTEGTGEIEDFCRKENHPYLGSIPYDPAVIKAVNQGKTVVDDLKDPADLADPSYLANKLGPGARAMVGVYQEAMKLLLEN